MPSPSAIRSAAARNRFVKGSLASYELATVQACDVRLQILTGLARVPGVAQIQLERIRKDMDLILDQRNALVGKR